MNNKDFDHIDKLAKDAFDGFEVEFKPSDWANFQQKLKAESAIDQIAKDTLEDYEVPFDIKDWNKLEKMLDKKERVLPFFWWFKTAEVGVVALSLFAVFNVYQKNNNTPNPDSLQKQNYDKTATLNNHSTTNTNTINLGKTGSIATTTEPQAMLDANKNSNGADHNLNNNAIAANSNNASTYSTKETGNNNSINRSNKNKTAKTATTKNTSKNTNNINGLNLGGNANLTKKLSKNTTISNPSNVADNQNLSSNNQENTANQTGVVAENNLSIATNNTSTVNTAQYATDAITAIDVQKNNIKNTDPLFEIKRQKQVLPFRCKTYLGGVATVGANFANSLGGTSFGYGLGFTMDTELSPRLALKTALIFSYKAFELKETYSLDKTNVDGNIYAINKNKTTHLSVLEIPLDMQYIFFQDEKWKLYITAGISANFIAGRLYTGSQSTSYQGLSISTDINSADYEKGLFEGGQFTQNAFLGVGAGLGIERHLGNNISLYILPSYRQGITPIGTDFMSTFNVNIGLKTVL